jgi:hypothetical protein
VAANVLSHYSTGETTGTKGRTVYGSWRRFDEVFDTLAWELQRVDKDFKRLTAAAAYLRVLLPASRRRSLRRHRCRSRPRVLRCRH